MKIQNLFENEASHNEILEWVYQTMLAGDPTTFKHEYDAFSKIHNNKFPAIYFVNNYRGSQYITQYLKNSARRALENVNFISGSKIKTIDQFFIYKDMIPPPCEIEYIKTLIIVETEYDSAMGFPDWFPKQVGTLIIRDCPNFTSLKGIEKKISKLQSLTLDRTFVKSHVLGLLMIKGLQWVDLGADNMEVDEIINRYLDSGNSDVFDCQEELIQAGLEEYAQL